MLCNCLMQCLHQKAAHREGKTDVLAHRLEEDQVRAPFWPSKRCVNMWCEGENDPILINFMELPQRRRAKDLERSKINLCSAVNTDDSLALGDPSKRQHKFD